MIEQQIQPKLTIPRVIGSLSFFNADNLEIMRGFADNEFDLEIVNPPYGIDIETSGTYFKQFKTKGWDNAIPKPEYF